MNESGYTVLTHFSPGDMPRGLFLAIMAIEQYNPVRYFYRLRAFLGNKLWLIVLGVN